MIRWFRGLVESAGLIGLACWLGGLAFYGGSIRPLLQERFGLDQTIPITRHVTTELNLTGLVTLLLLGLALGLEGQRASPRPRRWSLALLLSLSTVLLVALFAVHGILAGRMEQGQTSSGGFFPIHQVYLGISLLQWLTNVGLLLLWLQPARHPIERSEQREDPRT